MAKNSIRDYSATNSSNTDIQSIDISEGCSPAGINNAIREVMADLKDVSTGAVALESPAFDSASLTGDLTFGDNDKAIFGSGPDLEIYSDGTNAFIDHTNTSAGALFLAGDNDVIITNQTKTENKAIFSSNGAVTLYHDNAAKIATTSTGVDVTGGLNTTSNVGINTTTMHAGLNIKQSADNAYQIKLEQYNTTDGYGLICDMTDGALAFSRYASSAYTESMRLSSYGDVGIGRSDPQNIVGNHGGGLVVQSAADRAGTTTAVAFQNSSGNNQFQQLHNGETSFSTGSTLRMRVHSNGQITAYGNDGSYNLEYLLSGNSRYIIHNIDPSNGSGFTYNVFQHGGSTKGTILYNGTGVQYNTSSDYRLKENITADWDATTRLKQLNPVRFNFISNADITVDGFLAHEVQDIVPEAISGTKDGMRDEEYEVSAATGDIYTPATDDVAEVIHSTYVERPEALAEGQQWRETTAAVMGTRSVPDYQGIDQSKLVPLLVKTIQELEARITALEAN